ncbi:MAG: YheU family protein [Myxococcota bacterium]|nr:YheU family protein [Myxococcota bacterium]
MDIPHSQLARETLQGVIESYVNREGTDYGAIEKSLDQKVADVLAQLEGGDAKIVFDPETESIDIVRVD